MPTLIKKESVDSKHGLRRDSLFRKGARIVPIPTTKLIMDIRLKNFWESTPKIGGYDHVTSMCIDLKLEEMNHSNLVPVHSVVT
jgi:hypothetical protein